MLKTDAVPTIFKKHFQKPVVEERESSVKSEEADAHSEASRTAVAAP